MFPYLSQIKRGAHKRSNQQVWNTILNIKSGIGQTSGTWELIMCEYPRKSSKN